MSAAPQKTAPASAAVPARMSAAGAAPSPPQLMSHRTAVPPGHGRHGLPEPTFDELVTGTGRHRDPQELETRASLLRRLGLRARLLSTPARRPAARAAGAP